MKTLFVLRHAKSSWENAELSDFERPLNERGLEEAPLVGKIIFEMRYEPEIIVSSPAKRAKQTAVSVKENARIETEVRLDERIYEASPQRLIRVISELDDEKKSAMIVGHNPGLEGLIKILTGGLQPMRTASLAVIDLDAAKWHEISPESGRLRKLIRPKDDLKSLGAN